MKKEYVLSVILVLFFLMFSFSNTATANINTIINQMEQNYQRQLSGIKDLTIVQEMKGGFFSMENTTYHKKARVNNREVFMTRMETSVMGMDTVAIYDGVYTWSIDPVSGEIKKEEGDVYALQVYKIFKPENTKYLGEEKVDGKDAYKLQLDDAIWMMGMEDLAGSDMPEDSEIEMHGFYWIDKKDYVPLRSQNFIKTTSIEDGIPVTMNTITDVEFLDYRPVGSMLISYRMSISNQMEIDDPSLSPEEKKQAQAFMSSMGGMGKMEIVVTRAEYNTGLSDELFDGTKLAPQEPMFGGINDFGQAGGPMTREDMEAMMEGNEAFQDMMKGMIEEGSYVELQEEDNNLQSTTEIEYGNKMEWPNEIPSYVPQLNGNIYTVTVVHPEEDAVNYTIAYENLRSITLGDYEKELIASGWAIDYKIDMGGTWMLQANYGDKAYVIVTSEDEDNSGIINLSLFR